MKKNIKIIITKNTSNNIDSNNIDSNKNNSLYDIEDNSKIINSYIDDINNDIYKKDDEKIIYNLQYFINILKYITMCIINKIHHIIKKYIILIFLILLILYFYINILKKKLL